MDDFGSLEGAEEGKQATPEVEQVFASFGKDGYLLIPHTKPRARALFKRIWLAPLVLLLAVVATTIIAVVGARDFEGVRYLIENQPAEDCYRCFDDQWTCCPTAEQRFEYGICSQVNILQGTCYPRATYKASTLVWPSISGLAPMFAILVIDGLLVVRLAKRAPKVFHALARAGRLKPGQGGKRKRWGIGPAGWRTFATDLESALLSPARFALFGGWLLLFGLLVWPGISDPTELGGMGSVRYAFILNRIIYVAAAPLLMAYFIGFGLWLLIIVAGFIRDLTPAFEIDVRPEHGDRCGGLKRLGDLCIEMAIMITMPSLVFGSWALLGLLPLDEPVALALIASAFLIVGTVATLTFVLPLWQVHRAMREARDQFRDAAVKRKGPVVDELRDLARQRRLSDVRAEALQSELDLLERLFPSGRAFPVWPFSLGAVLGFFATQLIPVVAGIIAIFEFFAD